MLSCVADSCVVVIMYHTSLEAYVLPMCIAIHCTMSELVWYVQKMVS